ncbi:KR domain-containing protein [Shewanella sp. JM162201]|uniref:KR domain-containing protein n=1 Tax=Shewanella jiangmenensis TaxID=2837387 RepID=A0ABS5V2Q7_9GAMM|nr:type I polyketide synthase [Shewanella jiangmenensis]MBT1444738.1 KR domain-containing protein [Shewanella jiangmenensis]
MSESQTHDAKDLRLNKRLKDTPIAIVGMASLFANSRYLNEFWDLIVDKIDAITEVPADRWQVDDYFDRDKKVADKSYCKRGGFIPEVDFNPMEFGLPPNILELTDSAQLLSLVVAKEVLEDAGIREGSGHDRDKIGITLGIGGGQKISQSLNARLQYPVLKKVFRESGLSDDDSEMLIKKFQSQYIHWEENSFPGSLGNVIAGRIANRFDLGGMNCVVDAACAGSLAAVRMALTELTEGRADMMVTGGACTDNSAYMYMSFSKTPAFTVDEKIKPFDADSKGMMIGEGIGMIALKRLEDAERDGDKIYAVIKGVGASSDGKFKSIYAPRPEGQAKALRRAYDDAGFPAHTLGLMEAHGTGTAAGDVAEFGGLNIVMSEGNDERQHIALGSVKSQVGHTKSTAGTAGLIKAALALHHKVLPPTINVVKPNPKMAIEESPFYLSTEPRPWMPRPDGTPRRAAVSSFGFGGTNFHLVMEEYRPDHARAPYRLRAAAVPLLFAAATAEALLDELKALQLELNQGNERFESLIAPYQLSGEAVNPGWPRLGLLAGNSQELKDALDDAIGKLTSGAGNWRSLDMSFRAAAMDEKAKVAALFAGQGSQYLNMGGELAMLYPEMRAEFSVADAEFTRRGYAGRHGFGELSSLVFPIPKFDAEARKADEAALTNTRFAQSAIGAVSLGQFEILKAAGFQFDAVAGHSFGELSALRAAGVIDTDSYYRLAFERGDAMASVPEGKDAGTMAAVILPSPQHRNVLDKLLEKDPAVVIANHNSSSQLVLAGPTEAVKAAVSALSADGIRAIELPVSGAFHTPLVGHAHEPFAAAIDKERFSDASAPLYANASGDKRPLDGKSLKQSLKAQMLEQVQFESQIESLYRDGVRVFVEFGPKNTLGRLVEAILGERSKGCLIVSLDAQSVAGQAGGRADSKLKLAALELAVAGFAIGNPDPYRQVLSAKPVAKTALTIKLGASNYLSPATVERMAAALKDGKVSKQIEIVEKIVEKTQYVTQSVPSQAAPAASQTTQHAGNAPQQAVNASPSALDALFAAQQQLASLHQQFLAIPAQYSEGVQALIQQQLALAAAGQSVPAASERALELFHQHQAETLRIHTEFMRAQAASSEQMLRSLTGQPFASQPVAATQQVAANAMAASAAQPLQPAVQQSAVQQAVQPAPVVTKAQVAAEVTAPAEASAVTPIAAQVANPAAAEVANPGATEVERVMLQVVADKTGYPTEMLDLSMDMEADLGIDSIKRVEILGTVQDELPNLPELDAAAMAECRTLADIVKLMSASLPAATSAAVAMTAAPAALSAVPLTVPVAVPVIGAAAAPAAGADEVKHTMLAVVADKTGYPTEMLDLSMDMEADLGIDSIKRVEILGTVQDALPNLPELDAAAMAECRTLADIVNLMSASLPLATQAEAALVSTALVSTATVNSAPVNTAQPSVSAADITHTMLSVVADKTGYPAEMLDLAMDMEADLGIDSIKRVEILGTVQDALPNLPELDAAAMAECRTLADIVNLMSASLTAEAPAVSQAPVSPLSLAEQAQASQPTPAADDITRTMLAVVADKTGYPTEMLDLAMDMEADLGIDSIKRVEILGTVQDSLPNLPELDAAAMAECRTLADIIACFGGDSALNTVDNLAANAVSANDTEVNDVAEAAVAEVAEVAEVAVAADPVTEAPVSAENIEPDTETAAEAETLAEIAEEAETKPDTNAAPVIAETVEAETVEAETQAEVETETEAKEQTAGFDILAAELVAAVSETLNAAELPKASSAAELPKATSPEEHSPEPTNSPEPATNSPEPETGAEQERAAKAQSAAMQPSKPAQASVKAAAAPSSQALPQPSPQDILDTMLLTVADKTGYPVDMLDLAMDMEADLGIDSIKRVEILGTVQENLPGLGEVDAAALAECRTLGQIVETFALPGNFSGQTDTGNANTPALAPHTGVSLKKLPAANRLEADSAAGLFAADARVIVLDDGHNAGILAGRLVAKGLDVTVVRPKALATQSVLDASIDAHTLSDDSDDAVASFITDIGEVSAFIHLQPQENITGVKQGAPTDQNAFSDSAFNFVSLAFLFAKHLATGFSAGSDQRRAFITAARMDGKLGLGNRPCELNQAALFGLTKTLAHEWPGAHCRALDVATELDASALADAVLDALYGIDTELEWGVSADGRFGAIASELTGNSAKISLSSADKILVTGGAKGVTLDCALALAKETGAHFILAGRSKPISAEDFPDWALGLKASELKQAAIQELLASGKRPLPKEVEALIAPLISALDIQSAINRFEAVGASAEYLPLDVANSDSVARALAPIQAIAPITGLIHGAGVLADKLIQDKNLDELGRVFGTKVGGLKALLETLPNLELLALFSSAAGFYGNKGQSDYAMANEVLNKAAHQFGQNGMRRVVAFDWGPWDGGMVNESLKKMFLERGVYVIPRDLGANLFAEAVLRRDACQILVGSSMQGAGEQQGLTAKKPDGHVSIGCSLQRHAMDILKDHRLGGNSVLPTVCALDWITSAAANCFPLGGASWQVQDYRLLKGVVFDTDSKALLLTLSQADTGLIAKIECDGRPQYEASLVASAECELPTHDSPAINPEPVASGSALYLDGSLFHGPSLQVLGDVSAFDDSGLCLSYALSSSAGSDANFAKLAQQDALLQSLLVWARLKYDAASLPASLGTLTQIRELANGETGHIRLWVKSHTSRQLTADVALYDAQGQLASAMENVRVTISKALDKAFLSEHKQHDAPLAPAKG